MLTIVDSPTSLKFFKGMTIASPIFAILTCFGIPLIVYVLPIFIGHKVSLFVGDIINKKFGVKGWKND